MIFYIIIFFGYVMFFGQLPTPVSKCSELTLRLLQSSTKKYKNLNLTDVICSQQYGWFTKSSKNTE